MRALVLALVAACSAGAPPPAAVPAPPAATGASLYAPGTTPPAASGASLYDLGLPVLEPHRGERLVVSMFFGTCPAACPALIDDLARVVADAPDAHVLLVSFDPARDTPAQLAALASAHHLDARWTLVAADDGEARVLASAIGFKYRRLPDGQFTHTTAAVALDRQGHVLARMDRLGDHGALLAALRR
jgi:protein SCO1/2